MKAVKVSIDELKPYPSNPRRGNIKLIAESLSEYGQYKPIIVNKLNNEILVGNHTHAAARNLCVAGPTQRVAHRVSAAGARFGG